MNFRSICQTIEDDKLVILNNIHRKREYGRQRFESMVLTLWKKVSLVNVDGLSMKFIKASEKKATRRSPDC
jgi:hypothetical protein